MALRFKGCANISVSDLILVPFGEGSEVFACAKSMIGLLERIVIKRISVVRSPRTYGKPVVQYFDTHNRIWFANELCEEEDALANAEAYYQRQLAKIAAAECPPTNL
jgi:hypothetical protein